MDKPLLIWTSVINAQLNQQHRIKGTTVYSLARNGSLIEDIKVKVRQSEAVRQGSVVMVSFILDFLCLIGDARGDLFLAAWEESCRESVALKEFDHNIRPLKQEYMKINFTSCDGIGELMGDAISLDYYIDYSVIAVQEQIVELSSARQSEAANVSLKAALEKLEDEVLRVENENGELRKQLFIYERDISSLKRGLWKAENRNAILNREKKEHQALIEKLSVVLNQKETNLVKARRDSMPQNADADQAFWKSDEVPRMGERIKRLFVNSN